MALTIREFHREDIAEMISIWNEIVRDGIAFPQESELDEDEGFRFFSSQSFTGIAERDGVIEGLFILHPNNIGRCGHIANASYAVKKSGRGHGTGRMLVIASLEKAKELGFRIMQFNAVVESNYNARNLYESMGFVQLGTIPGGFRASDGSYLDICPYFRNLV